MDSGPSKEGSREWWEAKFQASSDYLYGKAPSQFLVENLGLMKKGEALDLGMGEGRNAVYLASKGFNVFGVDYSATAVERAKKLAAASGVSLESKVQDLDFFLIPIMKYDTIVLCDVHPSITMLKGLARGLAKGGTLLLEGYTMDQLRLDSGARPEPFECYRPNEPIEYLRDLHLIFYNEQRLSQKESRVQVIARKSDR